MPNPDFVTVRRSTTVPFGVLAEDLDMSKPTGYDLDMMRSLIQEGLTTPLVVEPIAGGRFRVLDGKKRLAAIQLLVRANKPVYDAIRCVMRPARRMFAILRCRVRTAVECVGIPGSVIRRSARNPSPWPNAWRGTDGLDDDANLRHRPLAYVAASEPLGLRRDQDQARGVASEDDIGLVEVPGIAMTTVASVFEELAEVPPRHLTVPH